MSKKKKKVNVFLAGPIAGVPNYKENFANAEKTVREKYDCFDVWNPADLPQGANVEWYMEKCLCRLGELSEGSKHKPCIVVALPNIGPTSGANVEIAYAEYLGIEVVRLVDLMQSKS